MRDLWECENRTNISTRRFTRFMEICRIIRQRFSYFTFEFTIIAFLNFFFYFIAVLKDTIPLIP